MGAKYPHLTFMYHLIMTESTILFKMHLFKKGEKKARFKKCGK